MSLMICCHVCCRAFDNSQYCLVKKGVKLTSKSVAQHMWGQEIASLNGKHSGDVGKCFLATEIYALAGLRAVEAGIVHQERLVLREKGVELKDCLRYPIRWIDPVLLRFLSGDHLRRSFSTKAQMPEARRRFTVLIRVRIIRQRIPDAYPAALFHFSLQYPEGDVDAYRDFVRRAIGVGFGRREDFEQSQRTKTRSALEYNPSRCIPVL